MPGAVARRSKGGGGGPPDQEDAFIRALNRFIAWAEENTGTLILAAVVLVLAVGGLFYWQSYRQSLEDRASGTLETLQARMARAGTSGAFRDSLQSFLGRFEGTDAAREARILLARQQLAGDEASAAMETVRPVAAGNRPDTPMGFAARDLLAEAQVAAGDTAGADSTLGELSERARFAFQRRDAAAERASLLADTGRLEEARAVYRRLVDETSDTETENLYALRLGEVEARLSASGGTRSASDAEEEAEAAAAGDTVGGG